jgi:hypothetical protein
MLQNLLNHQFIGTAFSITSSQQPRLHISTIMSTPNDTSLEFALPIDNSDELPKPSWQTQMQESRLLFSLRHDLAGNSRAKCWGLAQCPLGDMVATCYSLHPSDQLEYIVPSEDRVWIAINRIGEISNRFSLPNDGKLTWGEGTK